MKSSTTTKFRSLYAELPLPVKGLAQKHFRLWMGNPSHPSIQFKKVSLFWSVRITDDFRALAYLKDGTYYWFWIRSARRIRSNFKAQLIPAENG